MNGVQLIWRSFRCSISTLCKRNIHINGNITLGLSGNAQRTRNLSSNHPVFHSPLCNRILHSYKNNPGVTLVFERSFVSKNQKLKRKQSVFSEQADEEMVDLEAEETRENEAEKERDTTKKENTSKNKSGSKEPLSDPQISEQFVRGSGNGGQKVNKTNNKVVLKEENSGIVVQCHATRSLQQNRKIAQNLMKEKINEYNGLPTKQSKDSEKERKRKAKRRKRALLKYGKKDKEDKAIGVPNKKEADVEEEEEDDDDRDDDDDDDDDDEDKENDNDEEDEEEIEDKPKQKEASKQKRM